MTNHPWQHWALGFASEQCWGTGVSETDPASVMKRPYSSELLLLSLQQVICREGRSCEQRYLLELAQGLKAMKIKTPFPCTTAEHCFWTGTWSITEQWKQQHYPVSLHVRRLRCPPFSFHITTMGHWVFISACSKTKGEGLWRILAGMRKGLFKQSFLPIFWWFSLSSFWLASPNSLRRV